MDHELSVILNNLRTLSKLEERQKLSFRGDDISIQDDNWITTPLSRSYHGQSKAVTVKELENFINRIHNYVERLLNSPEKVNLGHLDNSNYDREQVEMIISNLTRITHSMKESYEHLGHLQDTYRSYPKTVSKLETICEEFGLLIKDLQKKLERLGQEK